MSEILLQVSLPSFQKICSALSRPEEAYAADAHTTKRRHVGQRTLALNWDLLRHSGVEYTH